MAGWAVRVAMVWVLVSAAALAQQARAEVPADSPDAVLSAPPAASAPGAAEDGRIFGVIPENKTVSQPGTAQRRFTVRDKFNLAFRDTTDPFTVVLAGFNAGIAQWDNAFPEYGQGGLGYAKRIGAAYADQGIGNYLTEAIVPTLLREDPRYFRLGTGSKWHRLGYAVSRVVVTRSDAGKAVFNFAEIGGNAAAAGISTLYYPASQRNAGEAGERMAVQVVSDGVFNALLEFWPDMKKAIFRK